MKGEIVLITGGAQGIGLATASRFVQSKSTVILTDIDQQALEQAAQALREKGGSVSTRRVDVADEKAVSELADQVLDRFGRLDVLVNNAGFGYQAELAQTTLDTWKKLIAVNLLGPVYHINAFLPSMIAHRRGHIANVSSGQAFFRLPTWGAYASVKAALGVLSEILHYEVKKYGVCVTTVYPFMVNTGFYDEIKTSAETFGAKLSMRLLPYYSYSPDKVGRIVYKSIRKSKKVEKASFVNDIGFYGQVLPFVSDVVARASTYLLAK